MFALAQIFGLHPLDAAVVAISLLAVLAIGVAVSRGVKGEQDFFVSGKTMGPWLTFFLNFGQATDSNGAPQVATEVYRQGIGGMWIAFQTLFITPFIWFTCTWFRRTRLITGPEMFIARFNSRGLATLYATFALLTVPLQLCLGNITSYKVAAAMMVKPEAEYTQVERESVEGYREYRRLRDRQAEASFGEGDRRRLEVLDSMVKRGLISSEISYVKPLPFYLGYTAVVASYIIMGGIRAAAVTDAFQGALIIAFSAVMIPLGLARVGGTHGLHDKVPEHFFLLFGSPAMSEYTWYSVAAIVFGGLVTFGQPGGPTGAAARDERTLRIGTLAGVFLKRFVMISWAFCGLLAVALVPALSDPDKTWGTLSKTILFPGLMGLMISGMLLGHMPAVGVAAVNFSATFTRNVYEPLFRGRSERHYMRMAQGSILAVLAISVASALLFSGVIELLTSLITFGAFFGATGFLMYFWRKLTAPAVYAGAVAWLLMMTLVAYGLPHVPALARDPALHRRTDAKVVEVRTGASAEDVAAGRATAVGQLINRPQTVEPRPLFFERIARVNPADPASPMEGLGRFNVECYVVSTLGFPLERFGPAGVTATRWTFAGIAPFAMLILVSLVTQPRRLDADGTRTEQEKRVDRFYARMKTPVHPVLEEDNREVALSEANPARFDHLKLLPGTSWEFLRWTRGDVLGFVGCWAGVIAILGFLSWLLKLGSGT